MAFDNGRCSLLLAFLLGSLTGWLLTTTLATHHPLANKAKLRSQEPQQVFLKEPLPDGLYLIVTNATDGILDADHRHSRRLSFGDDEKTLQYIGETVPDDDHRRLFFNWFKDAYHRVERAAASLTRRLNEQVQKVKNLAKKIKNEATRYGNIIKEEANKFARMIEEKVKDIAKLTKKIAEFPKYIKKTIVDPVVGFVKTAETNIKKLENIDHMVTNTVMAMLKKLDFIPFDGKDLADMLGTKMKDFMSHDDFCVPFDCITRILNLDILDAELFSSAQMDINIGLPSPKTCIEISKVQFDAKKLDSFLDLFKVEKALKAIFEQVEKFIKKQMANINELAERVFGGLECIKEKVEDALKIIGIDIDSSDDTSEDGCRRRLAEIQAGNITSEQATAIIYEEGRRHLEQLYGEHMLRVYKERNLAQNPFHYIGLKELKFKVTADFGQTFTLMSQARTAYSGTLFDEAVSMSRVFPIPLTFGMIQVTTSGSMEAALPYALSMEGAAFAKFGYNLGESAIEFDAMSPFKPPTITKEPFSTNFEVNATAGASATMALKFAAAASLGICLGPGGLACITIGVEASQNSAAGFDAMAGMDLDLELDPLAAMFADGVVDYHEQPICGDGNLNIAAGYWHYIQSPSVRVALTTGTACAQSENILANVEPKLVTSSSDTLCITV